MQKWGKFGFFVAVVIIVVVGVFLAQKCFITEDKKEKALIPELRLTLNNITLEEIKENSKEIKYRGNSAEIDGLSFDNVEIKGRGNATWTHPKKPYQLKLSQKTDLFGLGERRKWILISSYWDDTNLRTDTAFYLARMVGEKFAHSGEFVELYVNDEYEGLYYLTQGIEIGKNSVNLKDPLGVLVELDNVYGENENPFFVSSNGERLTVKDLVVEDNMELAMADFMENFNALEKAIKKSNYVKIAEIIDVESFAQYYLISEFTANPDAYFTSQYFYKDGIDDKIHAGPVWDFDIALNNTNVRDDFLADWKMTENIPKEYFSDTDEQYNQWSRLFARLIEFPEFRAEVDKMFQERMSGKRDELLLYLSMRAAKIYDVALKDSEKWEKGDFAESVVTLLRWISDRYDYFEKEYGKNYVNYDINIADIKK